jgi:hypothetical protein
MLVLSREVMMRAVRQALVAVLLLAVAGLGCGNNGDESQTTRVTGESAQTTTTMPPVATNSTTTTTLTGTIPATTETPLGDTGILRPDGIGPFGFGSAADEVEVWLTDQLGSPDAAVVESGQGGWPLMSCADRRFAYWADAGLTVGFTDLNSIDTSGLVPDCDTGPHLAGWYIIVGDVPWFAPDHGGNIPPPETLSLTTAEGIGLGSSAGDLREAYPTATFGEQDIDTYNPAVFRVPDTMWGRVEWNEASDIQKALNEHGANLVVDGILGPRTVAALVEFQTSHGITENGAVGPRTLAELDVSVPDDAPIVYLAAGTWDWDY